MQAPELNAVELDLIELAAKNRILARPDDPGAAPDALLMVREVRRLRDALYERNREVENLRAEIKRRDREGPPRYGICEVIDCDRTAPLGERWCHVHRVAIERSEASTRGPRGGFAAVEERRARPTKRRMGRNHPPDGDPSPGWENAVAVIEEG